MFTLRPSLRRQRALIAGLDIGSDDIRLVEFSAQRQLLRYASTHLPAGVLHEDGIDDLKRLIDTVRVLRDTSDAQARRVAISLPTAMTVTGCMPLETTIDAEDEDRLAQLARSHAANILPYPLAQASIDFCVLAPAGADDLPSLFVAAIRQDIIDDLLAMTEALALEAIAVDIAGYADYCGWMRTHAPAATALCRRIAMLRIEDTAIHCSLFMHARQSGTSACCHTQSLPKANTATQLPQAATALLKSAMTQTGTAQLDQIVLSGSNTRLAHLASMLQQQLNTDTIIAAPFAAITLADNIDKAHLQLHAPAYLTACGAALRAAQPSGTPR